MVAVLEDRIADGITDDKALLVDNAGGRAKVVKIGRGCAEQQIALGINEYPVHLFGKRTQRVMTAEARFDVSERRAGPDGAVGTGQSAVSIALDHDEIAAKLGDLACTAR